MLLRLSCPIARSLSLSLSGIRQSSDFRIRVLMVRENLHSSRRRMHANFRLCNVSGYTTELLEIHAQDPSLHVLFVPGNPGVVTFYKDFVESLYELLGGSASITAIGYISHTKKDWEHGNSFSLQDQIDHKVGFIKDELQNIKVPIILVGHSIGSYVSIEMFKHFGQVIYCIGLYPFLAVNTESWKQSMIGKIAVSPFICVALSSVVALLGFLPSWALKFLVKKSLGNSWSATAVEATCTHLLQYHCMRNMLFMGMTEFKKELSCSIAYSLTSGLSATGISLQMTHCSGSRSSPPGNGTELSETPDWEFMRGKQGQIAFLFGIDDHWGPLSMFEEISKQAPDICLSIEKEGHTHAFCCTEAGSVWVAQHVASLIETQKLASTQ